MQPGKRKGKKPMFAKVQNKTRLPLTLALLSLALVCFLPPCLKCQSAEALEQRPEGAEPPGKSGKPKLVSIVVTPQELQGNTQNSLKIKISFLDDDGNLRGGTLELEVTESNGRTTDVGFDLAKKKFGRPKGKEKFKTDLIIGDCDWLQIKARLRDAAENLSRPKKVKLDVLTDDGDGGDGGGPDWGTHVGERALDFTLYDQSGNEVSLHDYWGSVVLIDFSPQW
jgi:hypothetical protein